MALLFADGFDCYANDTQWIESGWARSNASNIALNTSEGRFGGGCIKGLNNTAQARVGVHVARGSTVFIGFSYKHDGNGGSDDTLIDGFATFGGRLFRLAHNASGDLKAYNRSNTQVGSTASAALSANTWYWIEMKVVLGTTNSNGSVEVRVNGSSLISASSLDIFQSNVSSVVQDLTSVRLGGSDGTFWTDDVVIMDGSGSFMNNFIGPTQIDTLPVTAAGGTTNWTANTGTQAAAVDDAPNATDDDTTYIESKTAGQEARFALANMTVAPNDIWAIQPRVRAKKENAGNRSFRTLINSGGTEEVGVTKGCPTNYAWMRGGVHYEDPDTSSAFTATGVNGLQAGVEIVA